MSTVCTVQRQCCAGVELSLGNNSRWPGSVLAGLGLDTGQYSPHIALHCQHCAICHTFIWYLSTISSHFTQYHFIVFFAHAHTERQTSFNSATSHILHILHNGKPSLQLRYDGVCSSARKWRVIIVITIIISLSAAGRVSDCRQWNSRVACIISSSHHHLHYPQQSASSRLSRVGVTIVTIVTIVTTPWSPTPRGWAAGAGS